MSLKLLQSTLLISFSFIWGLLCANGEKNSSTAASKAILDLNETLPKKSLAYVIPIREQIGPPILDITRRGLKNAISKSADIVILDMDTPGGELGVTLEIMEEIIENIERFEGRIFTYVNDEAISAGAIITQQIKAIKIKSLEAGIVVEANGLKFAITNLNEELQPLLLDDDSSTADVNQNAFLIKDKSETAAKAAATAV